MTNRRPAIRTVRSQQGQILILTALSTLVLVAVVGLALDSGFAYLTKAKLDAAVDAAGVAAARAITQGADQASQTAAAKLAAQRFFNANYPTHYLGSSASLDTPSVTFNTGQVTIDVSAQATVPTSLMRVLGINHVSVRSAAGTLRKDVDIAFVMDTSGSMSSVAATVRSAAASFLDRLSPTTDRVALIHFSAGAIVDDCFKNGSGSCIPAGNTGAIPRGFDRPTLKQHINAFSFNGFTNHAEGMWHARDQLNRIAPTDRSTLRVIVFFSDGTPNTFASSFTFKDPGSCPAPNNTGSIATGDYPEITGTPRGLYLYDKQDAQANSGCWPWYGNIASAITGLPDYYNAHNPTDREFPVVTGTYRTITASTANDAIAWQNINLAARNLPELMADKAKSEDIFVFSLGLGPALKAPLGVTDATGIKTGEDLLKCYANVAQTNPPDALPARCHDATKPRGFYCYAATANDLKPCFSQLASEILRITK